MLSELKSKQDQQIKDIAEFFQDKATSEKLLSLAREEKGTEVI